MRARHPVMKKTSSTPALPGKKADSGSDRQKRYRENRKIKSIDLPSGIVDDMKRLRTQTGLSTGQMLTYALKAWEKVGFPTVKITRKAGLLPSPGDAGHLDNPILASAGHSSRKRVRNKAPKNSPTT